MGKILLYLIISINFYTTAYPADLPQQQTKKTHQKDLMRRSGRVKIKKTSQTKEQVVHYVKGSYSQPLKIIVTKNTTLAELQNTVYLMKQTKGKLYSNSLQRAFQPVELSGSAYYCAHGLVYKATQ